jgi:hypothetical protein
MMNPKPRWVQAIPLQNSDHERIARQNRNPLQQIKVTDNMRLSTIADYLKGLGGADPTKGTVGLYANYHSKHLQLPLAMPVAEFFFVTGQEDQGEVRYSFLDEQTAAGPARPPSPHAIFEARPPPPPAERPRYPLPSIARTQSFPLAPLHTSDSLELIFHSGFLMFSNSFGRLPPSLEPSATHQPEARDGEVISLRRSLEMEIAKPK